MAVEHFSYIFGIKFSSKWLVSQSFAYKFVARVLCTEEDPTLSCQKVLAPKSLSLQNSITGMWLSSHLYFYQEWLLQESSGFYYVEQIIRLMTFCFKFGIWPFEGDFRFHYSLKIEKCFRKFFGLFSKIIRLTTHPSSYDHDSVRSKLWP